MTLFILTVNIQTALSQYPNIGTLFDCSVAKDLGIFTFPEAQSCNQYIWQRPTSIVASVYQYKQIPLPIDIALCRAEKITYECDENFFAAKEKTKSQAFSV